MWLGAVVADRLHDVGEGRPSARAVTGSGDARADAFRELVGSELDRAYRLAAVILGDRFDAEDAVHDAAALAWSRWADLRDPERFEAWFGRILINTCRDRLRRRRRRLVEIVRSPAPAEHPVIGDESDTRALRDLVRRAVERLSPEERIAVVLRYDDDLTVPAISRLIGVPEGTVKSRLHHALARLRTSISEADA